MPLLLQTPRLLLREVDFSDEEDLFEMDSDPEVHRYIQNKPLQSREEVRQYIEVLREQYARFGVARLAVVDKASGECMGWCGLKYFDSAINGHIHIYELGYRFKRKHWGKGLATEASTAVLDYGFENLPCDTIYAMTDPANENSKKVLAKLGFASGKSFEFMGDPVDWFELKREHWKRVKRG